MSDIRIPISVQADTSKLQALNRELNTTDQRLVKLSRDAKQAGSSVGGAIPGAPAGAVPMAGSRVAPFVPLAQANGMAGTRGSSMSPLTSFKPGASSGPSMPPVMWGASYRAQMTTLMAGHTAGIAGMGAAYPAATHAAMMASNNLVQNSKMPSLAAEMRQVSNNLIKLNQTMMNLNTMVARSAITGSGSGALNPGGGRFSNPVKPNPTSTRAKAGSRLIHSALGMLGFPTQALGLGGAVSEATGAEAGAGLIGGLAGTGVGLVAAAGIGAALWGVNKTRKGYATYMESANPLSNLYHQMLPGSSFGSFYNNVTGAGSPYGTSFLQMAETAQILASTGGAGALSRASLGAIAGGAIGLGYGVNGASTLAQGLSPLQQLGLTSGVGASASNSSLVNLLGGATVMGNMQGRTNDLITALQDLTSTIDQTNTVAPNATSLLDMMTTLNQSGLQSLQGTRGASILSSVNNALLSPGGGSAGQMYMYNALTRGTNISPFQEQYLAEQGLTGRLNGKGPTNLQRVIQYSLKMFPALRSGMTATGTPNGSQSVALGYLGQVLGLSMHQTQGLFSQFTHNGHFSMASLGAEQNWWQKNFGGMPSSPTMTELSAQLYNAHTYSALHKVAGTLTSQAGVRLTQQETNQFKALRHNPHNSRVTAALQKELGGQMMHATVYTSIDRNTQAVNQNTNAWTNVGKSLVPINTALQKIAGTVAPGSGPKGSWTQRSHAWSARGYNVPAMANQSFSMSAIQTPSAAMQDMSFGSYYNSVSNPIWNTLLNQNSNQSNSYNPNTPMNYKVPSGIAPGNVKSFVSKMTPYARIAAKKTGIPPGFILAQWGQETGWGSKKSLAFWQNNNAAGIKPWHTGAYGATAGPDSKYAGYANLTDFANGYASFLMHNSRYKKLLQAAHSGASDSTLASILGGSGYSTSANYGESILNALMQVVQAVQALNRTGARVTGNSGLSIA